MGRRGRFDRSRLARAAHRCVRFADGRRRRTTRRGEASIALALLASLAFVAIGLPDGLLGVAWPSIRATFGLPLDAVGALLISFTSGYVTASSLGGRLATVLGLPRLLAFSCIATAASLAGYALAPAWWMVIGLAAVAGIGAGGIDTGINIYAAVHHGPRMLSWLHACYGIGAAMGPALMTLIFAFNASWRWGYWTIAFAQGALATAFTASRRVWPATVSRATTADASSA